MLITSSSNDRIKHARRVREGRERDLVFVEGDRLVGECLASGLQLYACFTTAEPPAAQQTLLERIKCPVFQLSDSVLESLSDTTSTQGIIVIAERPSPALDRLFESQSPLLLGLDRIQDPGNLGTLVRTAEASGVNGIFSFAGSADAFAPKTLRSSMGSAFRLPILPNVSGLGVVETCRARGLKTVVATGEADLLHYDYNWRQPTLLILGNEGRGASTEIMNACDARVRIPLHEPVESLNVAAAGAAILFEAVRQRRA
ncbi:RNA methyltransferase [Prosthecobacter sp.]|uniref:TrmH family RNA methyltransferase n=1 Tax=Prosthecobacter sp. TaxID=1965333 RepID=UPI001D2CDE76|nr:RNA methyltransferase [Prosthecobacter sp.]MCB1275647.1 RNA methyltransferase [Prosthecobacter sp.]